MAPQPDIGATAAAEGVLSGLAQRGGGGGELGKRRRAPRQPWASEGGSSGDEEMSGEEEEEEEEEEEQSGELYQQSREGRGSEEGSSDEEEGYMNGQQWRPVPGQPGRWQLLRGGAGEDEESEDESISDEEEQESDPRPAQPSKRRRQQAGPALGGGRGRGRGRGGRLLGGVAGTGFHSILTAGTRWTSQVALNPTAMLSKFKQDGAQQWVLCVVPRTRCEVQLARVALSPSRLGTGHKQDMDCS